MRCAWLLAFLVAGCDARATPSASPSNGGVSASRALEACAATADCVAPLRCVDGVCQTTQRSLVGDFHAARAAHELARGATEAGVAALSDAVARYGDASVPVPPDIECAYARAVLRERARPERAEVAAKLLHRCALATPPGSTMYREAVAGLAELADAGLDPQVLSRGQPADLYLTRPSAAPPPPKGPATVKLTTTPAPTGRSVPAVLARLGEADAQAALLACHATWVGVTRGARLEVAVPMRAKFQPSDYDDEPGRTVVSLEPEALTTSPDGQARACVRAALEAATKKVSGLREGFAVTLTVVME